MKQSSSSSRTARLRTRSHGLCSPRIAVGIHPDSLCIMELLFSSRTDTSPETRKTNLPKDDTQEPLGQSHQLLSTLGVMRRQSNDENASSGRGQGIVTLSGLTEPGCGGDGTPHLSHEAGDDSTAGRVLQTLLSHVGEDGLHVELGHKVLHGNVSMNHSCNFQSPCVITG